MIFLWIWNWEEVLELHGTRESPDSPAVPVMAQPNTREPDNHTPNCRGPYSVTVPRIMTQAEPEPPSSSSNNPYCNSGIKLTGTGFTAGEADESKNEFREDGDMPGVAQPSRIIHV